MPTLNRVTNPPTAAMNVPAAATAAPDAAASIAPDARAEAERAAAEVHAISRPSRSSRSQRLDQAMRRLVNHYRHNPTDTAGMVRLLRESPEVGRVVAGASEDEIEASLGRVDGGIWNTLERSGLMGALRTSFDSAIRGDIVHRGNEQINRQRAALSGLEATVLGDLPRFQHAAAGTPEAAIAQRFGIRGDAGDAGRVRAVTGQAMDGLQEMQQWLQSKTWENGDLPRSATGAAARRGWQMTSADAFIEQSLIGDHSVDAAVHAVLDVAEHAHLGLEAVEAAEGLEIGGAAAAAGLAALAVGVAGLAFGLYIHHLGEEQQAEHIAAARSLGL